MAPLSARLRVTSHPEAALISIDGARLGATFLDAIPLSPGRHEIRVEQKGFKIYVESVEARPGQPVAVHAWLSALPAPSGPDPRQIAAALPAPVLPLPTPIPVFEGMF